MRLPKITFLLPGILLAFLLLSLAKHAADASRMRAPQAQPTIFPTPTPRTDGKIIYEVKEGDSLWRIAAIADISIEELTALNGLQMNDVIAPGMKLLLGTGGPAQPPTLPPNAFATPTEIPPTPTPVFGVGEICVLLFLDSNGNAEFDEGEAALPGGQVSVVDRLGTVAGEHTTVAGEELNQEGDIEGYCFVDLENGDYNVSAAVPPDYNPTTGMNIPVRLASGDKTYVQFGAQPGAAAGGGLTPRQQGKSIILGGVGVLLLLAAGGLGFYAARLSRSTPSSLE